MNDDELAAVVAAARLLFARGAAGQRARTHTRWTVAGRLRTDGAALPRSVPRGASLWAMSERLRD